MPSAPKPANTLSVRDGVTMLVGIIIGIGIFKTPPLVAQNVGSDLAFVGVWLLGGAITLIGALCYAELGSAHPHAGGEYHFLSRAYGRSVGVLFGWARGTVIQTGAIAAVAFVYGDYANVLIPLGDSGPALHAAIALVAITAVNVVGTAQSKATQLVFTVLTVCAVVVVAVTGLLALDGPSAPDAPAASTSSGALGFAMVFVLLTYGGWNEAAYLSGEMRDSRRGLVRTLMLGTAAVVIIYLIVNLAYLHVFGLQGLRDSSAVGADLMREAFGEAGAIVLSLIICSAALSTLNGSIFTGARVYYALGQDLPSLRVLGVWAERGHNPLNAFLLQGAIALVLIVFGAFARDGFQAMVEYTAPVFWLFMLLVGVSLFILRRQPPEAPQPYRVPLYPLTPALFCLTCLYLLYSSIAYTGFGALVGIAVLIAGAPLLLLDRRAVKERPAEMSGQ